MVPVTTLQHKTAGRRRPHGSAVLLSWIVILVLLGGCFPPAGETPPQEKPPEPSHTLVGTWVRPLRDRPEETEGIRFDLDGRFGLIGIHTMSGLQWRLKDRDLTLTTATERYPEPFETRLALQTLTDKTLILTGDKGYLRGVWHRDDGAAGRITGQITYRERMALPAEAAVMLRLEDVSRQDAPARFVAGQVLPTEGRQVPLPFSLYYATADIDPRHTYQVRADIVIDGQRRFLTARAYPVLTRGNPSHLEMTLQQAPAEAPSPAPGPAAGWRVEDMRLPATFAGQLPAASGGPLAITLNLYANRMFLMRKQAASRSGDGMHYDHGRWYLAHDGRRLVLVGETEGLYKLAVKDDETLYLSSLNGRKDLLQDPVTLQRSTTVDPFADGVPLAGLFRYMADAARFTECFTGTSFPVAQEKDYLALERAYLAARNPGAPLYVTLAGHLAERPPMEGEGLETVLVVDRFDTISDRSRCPDRLARTPLTNTTWKLTELYGHTIHFVSSGQGEPQLLLRPPERQLMGFSGCNGFFGLYRKAADRLSFEDMGATMMACPDDADLERTYFKALKATDRYKIFGQMLELYHGREVVARFEAAPY